MPENSHFKSFFNNLLASAAFELLKGPLVISLLAAMWQYLRHRSVDWWGVLGLFAMTVFVVLFARKNPNCAIESQPIGDHPDRRSPIYEMLPLEIDSLAIARQLRGFIDEMGPKPHLALDINPGGGDRGYAEARHQAEISRWETSLRAKYKNNFATEVTSLLGRLAEEGVSDQYVKPYAAELSTEQDCVEQVRAPAAYLTFAVSQIENKRRG
jgi:hypothetical protein